MGGAAGSIADLRLLRREVITAGQAFQRWEDTLASKIKPIPAGYISSGSWLAEPAVGFWPGRVDAYADLYTASVWNTYRVARLLITEIILKLSESPEDDNSDVLEEREALRFLGDILSSIPYHITEDVGFFLRTLGDGTEIPNPGKPVGGLFLMQHLHLISTRAVVPPQIQHYMIRCLEWIATHMGIGQAGVLSKVFASSFQLTGPNANADHR